MMQSRKYGRQRTDSGMLRSAGLRISIHACVAATVPAALVCTALAQSADGRPDSLRVRELDRMVVRGERMQEIIENPLVESPSLELSLSSVDEQDFASQNAHQVIDALQFTPGAWVETRGRKVKQFLSFRGQKYPYPDYAVDGVWQREFDELPYFFSVFNIERIEVMRSSAALINGVSGLAGMVNIIPKGYDSLGVRARTEYGSNNTIRGYVGHGNTLGGFRYSTGLSGLSTDGPEGRNAAESNMSGFTRVQWSPVEKLSIKANAFGIRGMRELALIEEPGDVTHKNFSSRQRFDPHRAFICNTRGLYKFNERISSSLLLYYTRRDHDFYANDTASDPTANDLDWEWGSSLTQALSLMDDNILRFNVLYNNWEAPNGKRFYSGKPANIHTISAAVADEHAFGALTVDGGVRWLKKYLQEWAGYNIDGSFRWKESNPSTGKKKKVALDAITDTWEPSQLNATLGLALAIKSDYLLSAHVAAGQVEPTPGSVNREKKEIGNELQTKADLGLCAEYERVGRTTLTGFYTLRKDGIALTSAWDSVEVDDEMLVLPLYENRDQVTYGLELDMHTVPLWNTVSAFFNIAAMRHTRDENGSMVEDPEKPDLIVGAGIEYAWSGVDCSLFSKYVSEYENDRFAADKLPHPLGDYSTLNSTLGYTFTLRSRHKLRVYTSAENILDNKYSTVVGYPDYGRRIHGGVGYRF